MWQFHAIPYIHHGDPVLNMGGRDEYKMCLQRQCAYKGPMSFFGPWYPCSHQIFWLVITGHAHRCPFSVDELLVDVDEDK